MRHIAGYHCVFSFFSSEPCSVWFRLFSVYMCWPRLTAFWQPFLGFNEVTTTRLWVFCSQGQGFNPSVSFSSSSVICSLILAYGLGLGSARTHLSVPALAPISGVRLLGVCVGLVSIQVRSFQFVDWGARSVVSLFIVARLHSSALARVICA